MGTGAWLGVLCFISLVHVGIPLFALGLGERVFWYGTTWLVPMLARLLRFGQGFKDWASRYLQGPLLAPSRAACPLGKRQRGPSTGAPWHQVQTAVLAWFPTGEISRLARTINRETILQVSLVLNSPDSATVQLQKQQLVAPLF